MSLIIHRCECGHTPTRHPANEECRDSLRTCTCRKYRPVAEPELLPTWTMTGRPITKITPPGAKSDRRETCSCAACVALYAELGGTVASTA
ncbi:hypothetical protein [Streptomyces sp. SID3343]|uniref:hypothetical protein n=1 Tax=Streptomyces sp. SID3343 TaxID=2690260 RepID=UPI00136CD41C|nr:hypothetical protein [Streptomyces sp. SID3343]MYW03488.1 hypothetical protein [Streptomyces sp. SID3343]